MKEATADALIRAVASKYDDEEDQIHKHSHYSGRGMYGKTTTGVSCSRYRLVEAIAKASYEIGRQDNNPENPEWICWEDFIDDISRLAWDSMGKDVIVY